MQKQLDDILLYSNHNEGSSVVAERFIRTLKGKIYKNMTANKPYFGYLNKLVEEYNNSINKKPIDPYSSSLSEEIESSHKGLKFKVGDIVKITKYKNIFNKG